MGGTMPFQEVFNEEENLPLRIGYMCGFVHAWAAEKRTHEEIEVMVISFLSTFKPHEIGEATTRIKWLLDAILATEEKFKR